jgi:HSP20 family protein
MLRRVHVRDNGDALQIVAEVPGFAPEELHVSFEQGSLVIRGELRAASAPEGYTVHRRERETRNFVQAFRLPARVDAEHIAAKLRDGILELQLPKVLEERARNISVQAA